MTIHIKLNGRGSIYSSADIFKILDKFMTVSVMCNSQR